MKHAAFRLLAYFTVSLPGLFFCSVSLQAQPAGYEKYDFTKADSVAALYRDHSLADLRKLSDKLTLPLSGEEDKFRAIYKWVCDNIENDYGFYIKNKTRREKLKDRPQELREWNQRFSPRVFQKLLREHKTICTGYAWLLKELSWHAGIRCEIIDGYGRTAQANVGGPGIANHSWNAVQLNNQWYLCDATWSAGSVDPRERRFIPQFSEAYFLSAPSLFVRNHYPLDTAWILSAEKPTLEAFLNGPLIYKGALSAKVLPVFPETFEVAAAKGKPLTFRFRKEGNQDLQQPELRMIQGGKPLSVYPEVRREADGLYAIDHVFGSKGSYVLHILLEGDYICTYYVRVTK